MSTRWEDHSELKILQEKLSDRFTKPTYLGGGGFGKVFKLTDIRLNRWCALKVLDSDMLHQCALEDRIEICIRFTKEARAYAICRHPNIVLIYDIDSVGDFPYILMEFIDGRSLDQYIKKKGHLELKEILRISRQILPAVGYLHKKRLIHRSLKPWDIMLEKPGGERIVLIDFGIVKDSLSSKLTDSGIAPGTPYYMAPEQWRETQNVTYKADIYSFGVMLYEMATGEVPFEGNRVQIMQAHMKSPVPTLREKNPRAAPGIQQILEKAMAKEPEDRYESAGDFLDALNELGAKI
ncbi:MAG: serine/threonine protein kinase [Candidatus Aminicenantes bacterium]|nr:serine/threonine protein kinase [Candidatus Aminicenantes bacterium]